jgi:hypothetical protein
MPELDTAERECLARYCAEVARRLGARLIRIELFGPAARGEDPGPHPRELDVLVVTRSTLTLADEGALVDAVYPLLAEFERRVRPHVFAAAQLDAPDSELVRELLARVAEEGVVIWDRGQ